MERHVQTSLHPEHDADAGERTLVIEADDRELARLRADLGAWLAESSLPVDVQRDVVLVTSELLAKVLDTGHGGEPIEIRCRHTHSLAVIEVAQANPRHEPSTAIDEAIDADTFAGGILRSLTSRLMVTGNANRTAVRGTFSFSN
jgi:anti-sigma regulatory factor (Ser/Thr protein kinase)